MCMCVYMHICSYEHICMTVLRIYVCINVCIVLYCIVLYRIACVYMLLSARTPVHTCINHLKSRINLHYMCRPMYIYMYMYVYVS